MKWVYCIVAAAVLLLLAAVDDGFMVLAFGASICIGLMMAHALRPSLRSIRSQVRLPALDEIVALATGVATAFLAFGLVAVLLTLVDHLSAGGRDRWEDTLGYAVAAAWLLAAIAPACRQIWLARTGERPIWPGLVGLVAAMPLGVVVALQRVLIGETVQNGRLNQDDGVQWLMFLAPCTLMAAFAGQVWWQALINLPRDRFRSAGLLKRAVWAAAAAWAMVILCLGAWIATVVAGKTANPDSGQFAGAVFLLAVAAAWVGALRRIGAIAEASLWRTVPATILLLFGFCVSLMMPAAVMEGRERGILVAILLLLPFIGSVWACRALTPRIMSLVLQGRVYSASASAG